MIDLYLLLNTMRDLTRPRKLLAAFCLIMAPGIMIWVFRAFQPRDKFDATAIYNIMSEKVVFGFVMVILAVVFCTSVVAQEVEDKTIVYLLTRPIPRFRILIVKFLPALAITLITVWLSLIFSGISVYGITGLSGTHVFRDLAIAPVGVVAYGCAFLLLATLLDRPLIYGLLYTFGWETWVPNLPGSFQKLSLLAYLRVLAPHAALADEDIDITQALTPVTPDTISSHLAWTVLICFTIIAFCLSLYFFSTREYVPRDAE